VAATFFVATRPCQVKAISEVHSVIASAACTITPTIDTGTDTPGAGTAILSAAFDVNGVAANTVQHGTVVGSASKLNKGDRLAIAIGTTTGLVGLTVTVSLVDIG
jgi:hypothetical protein